MPADATCSACQREVTLSAAEREAGAFDCPYCRRHVEALLGSELRCPACRNRLILSAVERSSGTFACPRCRGEFITRAPERQALVPPTVTAELAERDAQTKRLLTISSALGWGGLALAFFGGTIVGVTLGAAATGPIGLGCVASLTGAIVGQVARAQQRRLM